MKPHNTTRTEPSSMAKFIADFLYKAGKSKAEFAFGKNGDAISFAQWVQNRLDEYSVSP